MQRLFQQLNKEAMKMTKTELSRELKKAARRVRLAKKDAVADMIEEYVEDVLIREPARRLNQQWLQIYVLEQTRHENMR